VEKEQKDEKVRKRRRRRRKRKEVLGSLAGASFLPPN